MTEENIVKKSTKPTLDKDAIKGLPPHAQCQWMGGKWYVYFPYCFREEGVRKQERDYIGTLSEDGLEFKPNLYFVQNEPTFENRPPERWKSPMMRERALKKQQAKAEDEAATPGADLDSEVKPDQQQSVGATALAAAVLYKTGMVKNVATVFEGDATATMNCLNLAMHAALTGDKTYMADKESTQQKFIGYGCLSSPRASEFFQRIGADQSLSGKMAQACSANVEEGDLVALDGTKIDCNSNNIDIATIGKRKNGTYGPQINAALLVNVRTGAPVCYRYYAGNVSDVSTLDDLRQTMVDAGINQKAPVLLMDRGYPDHDECVALDRDGFKFLIGAKSDMAEIQTLVKNHNSDFYDQTTYLRKQRCYGVKDQTTVTKAGDSMTLHAYVFRSPNKEMKMIDEFLDKLDSIQKLWIQKKGKIGEYNKKYLKFFKNPKEDQPLEIDDYSVSQECYLLGYFGFIGNIDISLMEALEKYRLRNEVEVGFKLMFQNLLSTTRVHSGTALDGLMMTSFVGLGILSYLRAHMTQSIPNQDAQDPAQGSVINRLWSIRELLKDLSRIRIAYGKSGQPRLLNVVQRDRDLVAALGFPGLFDSAEKVAELLSGKHLAALIK